MNNNYRNKLPQTYQRTNITVHQQSQIKQPPSTQNITSEIPYENQVVPSSVTEENIPLETEEQNQVVLGEQNPIIEENESIEPNQENNKGDFKIRQVNIINKNGGTGPSSIMSSRGNHTNISIPSLTKTANNKNISRNGHKNIKFDESLDRRQNNIRNKLLEDTNKHTRAKSYFTERKVISNYLPQQLDVKKRLSHSVEVKRKTIVRGDKYNNIQITHIISVSKANLGKYNFHMFEKLSTAELNKKALDLTKIKLYIKKDPNAKSFYNTSCRNVPLRSAEKILKTVHYQHAGGRGMTNLKSNNLNSKFYQSGIVKIPIKEINKKAPIVKIINEFRSPCPQTDRNHSIGDKYNTNYKFNTQTYNAASKKSDNKPINHEMNNKKYIQINKKENEEKNKFSGRNYNNQTNIKNIAPISSRGNNYTTKTYTNNKYSNYNTNKPKETTKMPEKKIIVVNTNARYNNNNISAKNPTQINTSNIPSRHYVSQNYKKDINKTENIPTDKKEVNDENLVEIHHKIDSELKDDKASMEVAKPYYINKTPTSNITNKDNQKKQEADNTVTPKMNERINIEKVNEKKDNQKDKKIEARVYVNKTNNHNIKPQTYIRNINEPNKRPITNININKPASTNNYINNRNINTNKYQNSNVSKVITTSKRPVVTQNYQTYNPTINKNVISSKKEPEIKTETSEVKTLQENNLEDKSRKPELKDIISKDTNNEPSQNLPKTNNVNINVNKYKNTNITVTKKPEVKKSTTSNSTISSINNISKPSYTRQINVNINRNVPVGTHTNIKSQEKPNYRCITYARPSKNMTNVTHYVNEINGDKKTSINTVNKPINANNTNLPQLDQIIIDNNTKDNNLSKASISETKPKFKNEFKNDAPLRSKNKRIDITSNIPVKSPEIKDKEVSEIKNKEKEEINVIETKPEENNKPIEEKIKPEVDLKIDNKEENKITEEIKEEPKIEVEQKKEEVDNSIVKKEEEEEEKKEEKIEDKIFEKIEEKPEEKIIEEKPAEKIIEAKPE